MTNEDKLKTIEILNRIMELELAGVVKYTHYSLMVFGYDRIPIVSWLQANATESLLHAQKAGELVTQMGGHPSLKIGSLSNMATVRKSAPTKSNVFALGNAVERSITQCHGCVESSYSGPK